MRILPGLFWVLLQSSLVRAEDAPLMPRDLYGPYDKAGFLIPIDRSVKNDAALFNDDKQDPLGHPAAIQVNALNRKGFMHQARRKAQSLIDEPVMITESARVYSPSQSFMALSDPESFLMILHPQTSMSLQAEQNLWRFSLSGDRGLARISTLSHALSIEVKPADPNSPWHGITVEIAADSDIYLKYDKSSWQSYMLKGYARQIFAADRPLSSQRNPGLLQTWETEQRSNFTNSQQAIEIFAGQTLSLSSGSAPTYLISLPNPKEWQTYILRSSPQLVENPQAGNPLLEQLSQYRVQIIERWLKDMPVARGSVKNLMRQGRWEEALYLVRQLKNIQGIEQLDELNALDSLCLFRLQQESRAIQRLPPLTSKSPYAWPLHWEQLRSALRADDRSKVQTEADPASAPEPPDELYLVASTLQSQERWRDALDLWEYWPKTPLEPNLDRSFKEWQSHLDQQKPWSWFGSFEFSFANNVLHLPSAVLAPADIGHRSSWFFSTEHRLPYLLERSDNFQIQLEPYVAASIPQYPSLSELMKVETGLSLPISMSLAGGQTLALQPFLARLSSGSQGGMDRFGYSMSWAFSQWSWQPLVVWAQEQNLDIAPLKPHLLDPFTGEPTFAIDRSLRKSSIKTVFRPQNWSWLFSIQLETLDYRYEQSQSDSRQRLVFNTQYKRDFNWNSRLQGQITLGQDQFIAASPRSPVSTRILRLDYSYQGFLRLKPLFAIEQESRQSTDSEFSWSEMRYVVGIQDRW